MKARMLQGRVRVDRLTKRLVKRLRAGEIAVIAHQNLDELAAEALVQCRPSAVINAFDSVTGEYLNGGPAVLLRAGIPLIDRVGEELLEVVREDEMVRVREGTVLVDGQAFPGRLVSWSVLEAVQAQAQKNMQRKLAEFVENTLRYVREEGELLTEPVKLPPLQTSIAGKHCVVVARAGQYEADLRTIAPYVADRKPVLIAVDGAADSMLKRGLRPAIILGDMDSVSDEALKCGAEIVVHGYRSGEAPGWDRVSKLGLKATKFCCSGTSEDAALLLAYQAGADLIVAIGTHGSMKDFLDKGREGMASTFLARLKVSSHLVDARGVNQLYRSWPRFKHLLVLTIAGTLVLVAIIGVSNFVQNFLSLLGIEIQMAFRALARWLPF